MSALTTDAPEPLCRRQPADRIAWVQTHLTALDDRVQFWRCDEFLGQAQRLAERLPDAAYAINLCENRYLFMLAFCAAIIRGQTTLLPQNRAVGTQQQLLTRYPATAILHDGATKLVSPANAFNVNQHCLLGDPAEHIPLVEPDFIAALAFTSGSTGEPAPITKYWRTLAESSRINARYMMPEGVDTLYQLATVPAQHMWGLETSVLLPLCAPVCITDAKPLFPMDICTALNTLPEPRMLVSTPVHLRAMMAAGLRWPQVQRILCATAPLPDELVLATTAAFGGNLLEVYGCSEVGSLASRQRPREQAWRLFNGLTLAVEQDGAVHIEAAHLPGSVPLQDRLQIDPDGRFHLLGRSDDLLEIAGKRGSLQALNHLLVTAPGVLDGVVFMPDAFVGAYKSGENAARRPAALVVIDPARTNRPALLAHFAHYVDAAFIPRPLYCVDQLPREASGKLPRARLQACWEAARLRNSRPGSGEDEAPVIAE